ncbi:MAG: hypothetical protein ABW223_04210 [Rariglobus sp.]
MRRLFSSIVWLLAVLWLPATMHCGLEAAGVFDHGHADTDHGCAVACSADACANVEDGNYKTPSGALKIPAPVLTLCVFQLIDLLPENRDVVMVTVSPERSDPPPELACTWQFTARTALLPGAPSFVA